MKIKKIKLFAIIVIAALVLALVSATAFTAPAPADYGTQRDYILSLIRTAGLNNNVIGTSTADRDALFKSLGFLDNWNYAPTAMVNDDNKAAIDAAMADAFNGLRDALNKRPMEPYFVNGFAQPIFYYGNNAYNDTSGEGVARFLVYVETNYDTDNDGKRDLIKVMVQLPRAAVTQGMKCATIFHAQPYNEGTNGSSVSYPSAIQPHGRSWLTANGEFTHERLHLIVPPRVPQGEITTAEAVAKADWRDWRYTYTYNASSLNSAVVWGVSSGGQIGSLNLHDYFVVRGFALVSTAGIGSLIGEGIATYGADIEIDAYKSVIDWLNGTNKAYTDRTSNIEIKADWATGLVGMSGTSYGGSTPVGIATSGVKGLETIIPVCGVTSYYDYQNQQGVVNSSAGYTPGMVWYPLSKIGQPDWPDVRTAQTWPATYHRQIGYMQQMLNEATVLTGNYGDHWAYRDYTVDGWFKDWGPSKIHASMLIVHGTNDNNVRPKQSVLMHQMAMKAGVDTRFIWDQGHHMTPNSHQIGEYTYQEWSNLWYSYYLYKVDNKVLEKMPGVLAENNTTGLYDGYDTWECEKNLILDNSNRVGASSYASLYQQTYEEPIEYTDDFYLLGGDPFSGLENEPVKKAAVSPAPIAASAVPAPPVYTAAEESYTLINSANGTSSWQNLLNAPTAGSTLYSIVLPEDITVKGCVAIKFRAALATVGTALNTPTSQARVHAKLVEIARTGTTLRYYGGNAVGDTISTTTVLTGGVYRGGGLSSSNLVRFTPTTTGTYRELARGWMNLSQPYSDFDAYTSHIDNVINLRDNIGVFHDYTLYLQPTVHTAKKGNRLALVLTTGGTGTAAYSGTSAYTFNIDNEASYVVIPVEMAAPAPVTIEVGSAHVAPGDTVDITYSIKGNDHGFTTFDVDLPFIGSSYVPAAVTPSALLSGGAFNHSLNGNILNVTFSSADYVVGDGALFTVSYKVGEAAYAFKAPLDVKVNALQYGDFLDKMQDLDVTVKAGVLSTYSYQVYLKPDNAKLVVGDTVFVDVMLVGGLNYTQIATEIAYDIALLKFDGYDNLQGWAAAVTTVAPNKVAVRSIPGMNMVVGASSYPEETIVTLKFKVLDGFAGGITKSDISIASALVSPAGGVTGTSIVPCAPAPITIAKQTYANLFAAVQGETNAAAFYRASAAKALADGYPVIAQLFTATADAEAKHADDEWAILLSLGATAGERPVAAAPVVGATAENLLEAFNGETYEYTVMYPEFIAAAQAEGFAAAERIFKLACDAEAVHAINYNDVRTLLLADNVAGINAKYAAVYRCPVCGEVEITRPVNCPICNVAGTSFVAYSL
jgi:X-Pro dipeptidyl-peptidase